MVNLSSRALAAVALWTALAHGKKIFLDFEDLPTSNDANCGVTTLPNTVPYHGVFVSSAFFGNVPVHNTTKTEKCSSSDIGVFDQSRATSGPNVAFGEFGGMEFQIDSSTNTLVNGVSLDISVQLTDAEMANKDNIITFDTLISDFANVSVEKQFTFHTATDGFGPYHIVAPNTANYIFFEIDAGVGIPGESFRHPAVFVDNVRLETTEN